LPRLYQAIKRQEALSFAHRASFTERKKGVNFMHTIKRSLGVLITTAILISILGISAFAAEENGFQYTVTNGEAEVTGYTVTIGAVTIPDTLGGYPVTGIGGWLFAEDGCYEGVELTSVSIPKSVKSIGEGAFMCCPITDITLPQGLESIGEYAFSSTGLTNIFIPSSVTSIDVDAFGGCYDLTNITVEAGNTNYKSSGGALYNYAGTTLISCPAGLTGITISNGVKSITESAFEGCANITDVILPQTLTNIGGGAFINCTSLKSISIPQGVTKIGESTFNGCKDLINASIPQSVTSIGGYAFNYCTSLKSVTIMNSTLTIEKYAFNGCENFTICGLVGSTAQIYAVANGLQFVAISVGKTAAPTKSAVLVNGSSVAFQAYNIDGSNYFKLRDLAKVLSGTAKQVEVSWDAANNAINMTTGKAYTSVGGELAVSGDTVNKAATLTTSKVYLNGSVITVTAYNIGGNNYFKLRDVAAAINFGVTWNGTTNTIGIDTSTGYTA